jgi:PST family polysaccharide transporter
MRDNNWLSLVPEHLRRRLQGRHLLQKTIGSTSWVVLDKLIRLGLGLIVTVWTARYLGPSDFGMLNFATAFVALFSVFANLGMQGVIVRDLVNHPDRRDALLGSAIFLRLLGSVLATIGAIVVAYLLRQNDIESFWVVTIVAIGLVPQSWDLIDYAYQADIHARPIVILRNVSFVICAAGKLALIAKGGSVLGFAWLTTAEFALTAVLMGGLAAKQHKLPRILGATRAELRYLIRTCWPLVITGLSVLLYWRIDQVMLGQMAGDATVGVFSAAVRVSEVWYFFPTAITSAIAPALTIIYRRSETEYLERLFHAMRLLAWMGVAMGLIFALFSSRIIHILYGAKYEQAGTILAIHGWAGIFVAMGLVGSGWFLNRGLLSYSMYQTFLGALTNIVLNLFLIPAFGGVGAAVSTVVSYAVAAVFLNAVFPKCRELFWIQILSCLPGRHRSRAG